ncbi:MAG TPA: glycosyltransferase family 4 protein [Terriglobia bacterium]|nr:glycosyltransferase family 4 protein [Terriglobia bacterium]
MQVVHLTSVHPAFDVRIFQKECGTLAEAGHQVTLIAPHDRDEQSGKVAIHAVAKSRCRASRMLVGTWRVYRRALREPADAYHFHDPELIPVGLLLRAHGKPVVYDLHEDVPCDILGKDYLPKFARRPLAFAVDRLERIASRLFSGLVAATPAIARRFGHLDGKLVVVQNFPLRREFASHQAPSWQQRSASVAYAGCITRDRGVLEMVEAINLVSSRCNANLKLAGEFWPENLRTRVKARPGWQRVAELGLLPRSKVSELFATASAGLLVFHPDPNNLQAQPNKLFEYMAAGLPVIASNFPLWKEIVAGIGCGVLVDPLKPTEIADAIEYLLTHPAEAEQMGIRGREAVEKKFNWEYEERKLLQFYGSLREPTCVE